MRGPTSFFKKNPFPVLSTAISLQDINTNMCVATDGVQEFTDEDNTDFETVFVLADFDCPEYGFLYKRDHRIVGPPMILHCAAKEEVGD